MVDWTQGAEGAAGGAAVGSIVPGVGTAIGAGIGGLIGMFGNSGASQYQSQYQNLANQYGGRKAPQGTAAQSTGGIVQMLQSMAGGSGPSAAALQMREAMDRAAGAQAGAAAGAGGRGVNQGAALRNATNQTAAIQANNANATGQMRVQEQMQAMGQALQNQQFNAGAQNGMTQANMQAYLNMQQMNQQGQLQALQGAAGVAGPGTGAALMAGGAQALPGILQYLKGPQGGVNPTAPNYNNPGYDNSGVQHTGGYDADGNGYGYAGQ